MLDVLVAAAVEGPPTNVAPPSPAIGSCHIVGAAPTGDWAGQGGQLAAFTAGGWRFLAPREGTSAHVASDGTTATYRGGAWDVGTLRGSQLMVAGQKVVGSRAAAIAAPTGGTTIDAEARTTIGQILTALREHGLIAT